MDKPISKQFPVYSHSAILTKLRNLNRFILVGYLEQIETDVHKVRLTFRQTNSISNYVECITSDFYVTECAGYMRAVSLDGHYSFAKLT